MAANKTKRYPSEKSLANLKKCNPQNNFHNPEVSRAAQKKGVAKRRENKLMRQVVEEKLNKLYADGKTFQEKAIDQIEQMIAEGIVKPADLVSLLTFLRDTAGQKPVEKQAVMQSSVVTQLTNDDIKRAIIDVNGLADE